MRRRLAYVVKGEDRGQSDFMMAVFSDGYVIKEKGEKIDHIADLSTLTLLQE